MSSAFNQVGVTFNKKIITPKQIEKALAEEGYTSDALEDAYPVSVKEREMRHTAAVPGIGDSLSFAQNVSYEGRALWPCPGFSIQAPTENV